MRTAGHVTKFPSCVTESAADGCLAATNVFHAFLGAICERAVELRDSVC